MKEFLKTLWNIFVLVFIVIIFVPMLFPDLIPSLVGKWGIVANIWNELQIQLTPPRIIILVFCILILFVNQRVKTYLYVDIGNTQHHNYMNELKTDYRLFNTIFREIMRGRTYLCKSHFRKRQLPKVGSFDVIKRIPYKNRVIVFISLKAPEKPEPMPITEIAYKIKEAETANQPSVAIQAFTLPRKKGLKDR